MLGLLGAGQQQDPCSSLPWDLTEGLKVLLCCSAARHCGAFRGGQGYGRGLVGGLARLQVCRLSFQSAPLLWSAA